MRLLDGHDLNLGALARLQRCFSEPGRLFARNLRPDPVEAMASRLPVVASDWNGYRDTVVEGRTGFRVPTQSFEPGWNDLQLEQLARNDSSLDRVLASVAKLVWMLLPLGTCPSCQITRDGSSDGCLGERRVQENYDWSVVLHRYELLDDLLERREQTKGDSCLALTVNGPTLH